MVRDVSLFELNETGEVSDGSVTTAEVLSRCVFQPKIQPVYDWYFKTSFHKL